MPRKNGNGNSKSSGNGAAKKRKDEQGRYVVGAHVWAKYNGDNSFRDCEVIEVEVSKKDERVRYYVHYVEFNRRMDTWVKASEVFDTNPENPDAKLSVRVRMDPNATIGGCYRSRHLTRCNLFGVVGGARGAGGVVKGEEGE